MEIEGAKLESKIYCVLTQAQKMLGVRDNDRRSPVCTGSHAISEDIIKTGRSQGNLPAFSLSDSFFNIIPESVFS